MQNQVTKKFHSDAGHGWLAVKITDLFFLGIQNEISGYSYMRGDSAYLEEDCDTGRFLNAAKAKGIVVTIQESDSHPDRSPIRSYFRYDSSKIAKVTA